MKQRFPTTTWVVHFSKPIIWSGKRLPIGGRKDSDGIPDRVVIQERESCVLCKPQKYSAWACKAEGDLELSATQTNTRLENHASRIVTYFPEEEVRKRKRKDTLESTVASEEEAEEADISSAEQEDPMEIDSDEEPEEPKVTKETKKKEKKEKKSKGKKKEKVKEAKDRHVSISDDLTDPSSNLATVLPALTWPSVCLGHVLGKRALRLVWAALPPEGF